MKRRGKIIYIIFVLTLIVVIGFGVSYLFYHQDIETAYQKLHNQEREIVETAYGKIEYVVSRDNGFPLLMIHGAAGGFDQGLDFADGLVNSRYKIIAPSRFGYINSEMPDEASPGMQADAFISLLDKLGIEEAAVMAVSAGGPSAVQLALNYSERVSSLVLVSTAMADKPLKLPPRKIVKTMIDSDYIFWLLSRPLRSFSQRMFVPPSYDLKPAEDTELDEIMKGLLPIKPRSEGLLFDIFVTNTDIYHNSSDYVFEEIEVPTLVVNAEDDPAADYGDAKEMSQRIPHARFVSVKEGGHIMFGNNGLVAKEVNSFLTEKKE